MLDSVRACRETTPHVTVFAKNSTDAFRAPAL
jgi:hypothetical protein